MRFSLLLIEPDVANTQNAGFRVSMHTQMCCIHSILLLWVSLAYLYLGHVPAIHSKSVFGYVLARSMWAKRGDMQQTGLRVGCDHIVACCL